MAEGTADRPSAVDGPLRWRRLLTGLRPYAGWCCGVAGAVCLFVTWWDVSGQPIAAKQLPYLVSGGFVGVALLVAAAVFAAADGVRRDTARLSSVEAQVAVLYRLFVEEADGGTGGPVAPGPDPAAGAPDGSGVLVVEHGETYHRPGCQLVAGKRSVRRLAGSAAAVSGLRPCPVCRPEPVTAAAER